MHSRSAIHQQRPDYSRMRSSSSQAGALLHGWSPEIETEREPNAPSLGEFTRGLPKRNRAPRGPRSSASKRTAANGNEPGQRRPSLVEMVEKLRAATSRRLSETASLAANWQEARKKEPSWAATARRRISNASLLPTSRDPSQKRGPSLVEIARELVKRPPGKTDAESSSRQAPEKLSSYDAAASENEKMRLEIESKTRSFDLVQRWKDPTDWLKPSNYWKRKHPAMNFRLWRIIQRNPLNSEELQASAESNLEAARLLYEKRGGCSGEWWPADLEEEILDSWSLCYGGRDPPRHEWRLEE